MKKLILLLILCPIMAMAQTRYVVSYDGTNLYSKAGNTQAVDIASNFGGSFFKPAYGCFQIDTDPFVTAISSVVTNGTITAGSVTNTWEEDNSYYTVQETGRFEVYFTFTNDASLIPQLITFNGRYDGLPAHNVFVEAYDYVDAAWERFTAVTRDLPSSATDANYSWKFPTPRTNYISGAGLSSVRFRHDSVAISTHYLYMDYLALTYATLGDMTGGTWYDFMGVILDVSNNVNMVTSNATAITIDDGDYRTAWYISFTGSTNTTFTIRHLTNDVPTNTEMWRTIGSSSAIGSGSAFGFENQAAGTTNSWQIRADRDDAWFTIVNGHAEIRKVSN